ncbi:hypothetical protein [Actinoplanes sp. NPDC089786]|uniref:hypothetical protein n=1 Tax=Actinoplanes sp. NPDC089786 TaxID=3155185 RepID=UPI00343BAE76
MTGRPVRDPRTGPDRTTVLCGAEYEWGIHVAVFATRAGITEDQVRPLTTGTAADVCWTDPGDRAVITAVDAPPARHDLTDDEWAPLVEAAGPDGAIDLMLICGWYHAISYVARAARLAPEPGSPTFDQISRQISR